MMILHLHVPPMYGIIRVANYRNDQEIPVGTKRQELIDHLLSKGYSFREKSNDGFYEVYSHPDLSLSTSIIFSLDNNELVNAYYVVG